MKQTVIEWRPLDAVVPYEKNARINDDAVPKVAESIRQFGFLSPIVVDRNAVILAGHTRYKAAQTLGLESVPVLVAADLDDARARAYRLADNKVAEYSRWDIGLLVDELNDLSSFDCDMSAFGFDTSELFKRRAAWSKVEKRCDLKRRVKQHLHGGMSYTTLFECGKRGIPIAAIKEDAANVEPIAYCLVDYLSQTLGDRIEGAADWSMVTTPRRRHRDGFHFATEISRTAAENLHLPFVTNAFRAEDRNRIDPHFELISDPAESNVILFDDIVTTGSTIRACRQLLVEGGHCVLCVIGIKN